MTKPFIYDENDPRPYMDQYEEWELCHDTKDNDISSYPGRGDEQGNKQTVHIITKRGRRE